MKIAGRSDIGLIRAKNQDNYLISENKDGDYIAIVCDGIGGAKAGEVASLMAIKVVGNSFVDTKNFDSIKKVEDWFKKSLNKANDSIFSKTIENSEYAGMGTTFVAAVFLKDQMLIANVGDSRAYVLEKNQLKQVTKDHSLVNELLESNQITKDEVASHPQRNVLTNALGVVGDLRIDFYELSLDKKLLLCSDGLSGYVLENKLYDVLSNDNLSIDLMLEKLIDLANSVGGYDNITAVIADMGGVKDE